MLTMAVKKLCFLVKTVLFLLIVLLLLPRIASASCFSPSSVSASDEADVSVMVDGLRRLGEYECASYRGTVFLDENLPLKVMGIRVGNIDIVQAAEGVVTASVDLTGLSREDVQVNNNSVTIRLPSPVLACHEIAPQWSIYPRSIPIGSADDIALLENSMAEQARVLLCQLALGNGLLEEAKEKLKRQASEIATACGYEDRVMLEFDDSSSTMKSPADDRALPL